MKDEESLKFSWSGLFTVTAFCSLVFNIALKLLNNYFSNVILIIGCTAFLLGILNWLGRIIVLPDKKKTNDNSLIS